MGNVEVLVVQEQDVSQIEETVAIRDVFSAFSENAPKSKIAKKIIGCGEFKEEWEKCLKALNSEDKILEEPVGDCREEDIRDIEEGPSK